MAASPSRSDSFSSRGGLPRCCKARRAAPSFERLDDVHAALGESFNSSTASFIDMDPEEELFSMRWTSSDDGGLDHFAAPPCAAGAAACSPLLTTAGIVFSDEGILPCEEPSGTAIDAGVAYEYASAGSSPAFHTAQSTPAVSVAGSSSRRRQTGDGAAKPLLATRRLLLRYLRFLAPLCRKARALRVPPARAFSAPRPSRSLSTAAATPARRSTSSAASAAESYWCHGNADTAVRDAILHCKKSLLTARTEC
ncbi:unnamed protein product [Urochloa decumbens]|uniref:Membrane-associated kinase regulator 6 n=1 Tax=Urochloa decumbens TaxID=240449 RepID=A0ABC8YGQ2_9POAL